MNTGNPDPRDDHLRISDAERDTIVDRLNVAVGEGRITLAEFSERAGLAQEARTRADVVPLTADLPDATAQIGRGPSTPAVAEHVPVGAIKRMGGWKLASSTTLSTTFGPLKVDLSGAQIDAAEVDLHLSATLGSIKVWVPEEVRVEVTGSTVVGTRTIEQDSSDGTGPLIRITADTRVGTVKVYRT